MRRNNRLMGRQNMSGGGGNGPLMTNHLKDIDLELELLKRKREMIEQQQLILIDQELAATRQFSYNSGYGNNDYNSRRFDDKYDEHFSENRGYSDDRDFSDHRSQFGRKRQADPQWKNAYHTKKPAKKGRGFQSNFDNRLGPAPGQSGSGFSGSPRNQKPGPNQFKGSRASAPFTGSNTKPYVAPKTEYVKPSYSQPKKTFTPKKVIKASPTPNKIASKPSAEQSRPRKIEACDANMLLPDREPTVQVAGRLELALGSIIKEINEKYGINSQPKKKYSFQLQRLMKQNIRERIRGVMMGKTVGNMLEILAHYREVYPPESDIEILNMALDAVKDLQEPQITLIESENAEEFYKRNIFIVLEKTLKDMFSKVEKIYIDKDSTIIDDNEPADANKAELNASIDNIDDADNKEEKPQPEEKETVDEGTTAEPTAAVEELTAKDVEQTTSNEEQSPTEQQTDIIVEQPPNGKENEGAKKKGKVFKRRLTEKDYEDFYKSLDKFSMERIMPRLIKKYIPYIIKLLNMDPTYKRTTAHIMNMTNKKVADSVKKEKNQKNQSNNMSAPAASSSPNKPKYNAYNLPYYVKVMGRPSLPKKKIMQTFLDPFNPKSIKKHKNLHNLLFIGFTDKKDYDAIIVADGTKLGRSTLSIRICEKNGKNENKDDANNSINIKSNDSSEVIDPDLDGQISDLLTSIRQSEEANLSQAISDNANDAMEVNSFGNGETNGSNAEETNASNTDENTESTETKASSDPAVEMNTEETNAPNAAETYASNTDENAEATETKASEPDLAMITEPSPPLNGNANPNAAEDVQKVENEQTQTAELQKNETEEEKDDRVADLKTVKEVCKGTPTRASSRLANVTPSSVRTRRSSKLVQE